MNKWIMTACLAAALTFTAAGGQQAQAQFGMGYPRGFGGHHPHCYAPAPLTLNRSVYGAGFAPHGFAPYGYGNYYRSPGSVARSSFYRAPIITPGFGPYGGLGGFGNYGYLGPRSPMPGIGFGLGF